MQKQTGCGRYLWKKERENREFSLKKQEIQKRLPRKRCRSPSVSERENSELRRTRPALVTKRARSCRGDRGTLGHGAQWDNGISWETPNGRILKILSHDLRDTPVAILFS